MKRRLFTILSALSLLLCVAVVVMWVRSYWTHHLIIRVVQENHWHVSSVRGKLWLFVHESKDEWTGNYYALLSGPPGGQKSPSRGGRRPEGSERYFRLDRYPVATLDQERRTAWDDLLIRRQLASGAAGFYGSLVSPWAEREYLNTMQAEMRAWARWQAADAPTKGKSRLGFRWHSGDAQNSPFLALPYWSLFAFAASIPAVHLVFRRQRARRRARTGLCPSCGYDLRATPGRCPECGLVPAAPPPPPPPVRGNVR